MTPQRLREYVLIAVRDALIPLGGVFLAVYLTSTGRFEPWQLPLLAGMMGVPLVARGGGSIEEEDARPTLPPSDPPVIEPPPTPEPER